MQTGSPDDVYALYWSAKRQGDRVMRRSCCSVVVWTAVVAGCASSGAGATNVRAPLGAQLTGSAPTGPSIPLRFDSTARVIRSTGANLTPATYWPAQAERGERVFNQTCAMCHARSQFIGESFVETWSNRRVFDFYALVRSTMPLTNPGGLKEDEYLALVAYLLKANHGEAGTDSLRSDTLALRSRKIAVRFP
jgi:mono/diheme cytochrome c family protein